MAFGGTPNTGVGLKPELLETSLNKLQARINLKNKSDGVGCGPDVDTSG
jgi:hypothetical protein